jgi:type II secretory pathway pseudopilin PulG
MMPGFYMPDDTTLLIAPHPMLTAMLMNQKTPKPGALSRLLSKTDANSDLMAVVMIEAVRPMLGAVVAQAANELPPQLQGVAKLPDLIDAAKVDIRVVTMPGASLALLAPDEVKAAELAKLLNDLLDMGEQFALAQVASEFQDDDPVQVATAQYTQRITKKMIDAVRPTQSGRVVKIAHDSESNMQVATIGILVALLLPAVQAAREAARRMSSSNNLKQIALAMHNYHDVHGKFPPRASLDDNGKPLLSWRVHLLPYLDQAHLYEQFRLDEPWDSDHNSKLIEAMPAVFRNPSSTAPLDLASYVVPVGEGSIFASAEGTPIRSITDGTSNTIMVLEVNHDASVIWTKPEDLNYDSAQPLTGLGNAHPGGFMVSLADGSVRFISASIDKEVFLRLLQMADGQAVRLD